MALDLTSPVFGENQPIPAKHTCDGDNVNPPLTITGVEKDAKTLCLIIDDPDAPAGIWVHWLVWNLDPTTQNIEEAATFADAKEGTTSFGEAGYGGPCPPSGTHSYQFKLFALDKKLNLEEETTKTDLEKAMSGHILDEVILTGTYTKKS